MIKEIYTDNAPRPVAPYSQAIIADDKFIFVSGQIPIDPKTGNIIYEPFSEAARMVFKNISEILKACGSGIEKVVKVTVYLSNMDNYAELNKVYEEFFKKPYPARTVVQVSRLPRDVPLEVEVVALK